MLKRAAISLAFLSIATTAIAEEYSAPDGQDLKSPFLRVYGMTLPPIGHVKFCEKHPEECIRKSLTTNKRFSMTPEKWRELKHMNKLVNKVIKPITDQKLYGQLEHWTYPSSYQGDCEDYVLLKRQKLIERGWPESSLLITVVLDENREGHAILTARTAQGDFMLDNKTDEVLAWNQVPYKFIKRQSYRDPKLWVSLISESHRRNTAAFAKRSR